MRPSAKQLLQVINGIQTGPYKNIYNPENFYVGKDGVGAANNWGDGYQSGEAVYEDIMEMIDREADGSDSLEVSNLQVEWDSFTDCRCARAS
jgi:hypothetical protein